MAASSMRYRLIGALHSTRDLHCGTGAPPARPPACQQARRLHQNWAPHLQGENGVMPGRLPRRKENDDRLTDLFSAPFLARSCAPPIY